MLKIRRLLGIAIIKGTTHELERIEALAGMNIDQGEKLVKLPREHHVHRNPRRKPIFRYIEDKEAQEDKSKMEDPKLDSAQEKPMAFKCPDAECGARWGVIGLMDNGRWTPYDEDQIKCPDCGKEGEEE